MNDGQPDVLTQSLQELGDYVQAHMPDAVSRFEVKTGELIVAGPRQQVPQLLRFLRDDANCQFTLLVDVCGVDYPDDEERFEIVYNLLSVALNQRIRVKVRTEEHEPVPSVTEVFSSAGWFEREVWDMYGVFFADHPDLRRILTDYGFEGHPLRKDFPLTGYVEVRYDESQKRVVYEPVSLVQEFRNFDFVSPWEGMNEILPGDEKAEGQH